MSDNSVNRNHTSYSSKWLYILLFLTLVGTVWTSLNSDEASESTDDLVSDKFAINSSKRQAVVLTGSSSLVIPWTKLERFELNSKPHDVFKAHSWVVKPAVKKAKILPPPAPVAPNVPFTYVGKLENSPKGTQVFLMGGNKLYSVLIGEKVDAYWQLDSEEASTLQFTYLPLKLKQVLSKSAKQNVPVVQEANQ